MSRHYYAVTFDIEVSPDVSEDHVSEGAYSMQFELENRIAALVPGNELSDVDVVNISIERNKR